MYTFDLDFSEETSKFGKGDVPETTVGSTVRKSKEMGMTYDTECSEEIENEELIIPPPIEDSEKTNLSREIEEK